MPYSGAVLAEMLGFAWEAELFPDDTQVGLDDLHVREVPAFDFVPPEIERSDGGEDACMWIHPAFGLELAASR